MPNLPYIPPGYNPPGPRSGNYPRDSWWGDAPKPRPRAKPMFPSYGKPSWGIPDLPWMSGSRMPMGMPGMGPRMPMAAPRTQPETPITQESWFPELYEMMYGKVQGGQRGLMNQITGNLGRTMGSHLSRTNVAVPVGADALARRYMSPLSQAMERGDPMRQMQQAMSMAKMFGPGFKGYWGEKDRGHRDPLDYLEKYMGRYWGGGR